MSKLGLILIALVASTGAAYHTGVLSVPEFGMQDRGDWGEVTDERIEIKTTAWIYNDNPVTLNLDGFRTNYRLKMNGVKLAEGRKKGLTITEGNQTVKFTTEVLQNNIPDWWASHIRKGEKSRLSVVTDLKLETGIMPLAVRGLKYRDRIETDLIGRMNNALEDIDGSYRANIAPELIPERAQPEIEVRGGSAKWGRVTENKTEIKFSFDIHNPNSYPVPTPEMAGNFKMNGIEVADWNANELKTSNFEEKALIESGETREITFTAEVRNRKVDDWLTEHIRRKEKTNASVNLKLVFDFEDHNFQVPPGEGLTCNFNFQTAILVDDQKTISNFQGCENPLEQGQNQESQEGEDSSNEDNETVTEDPIGTLSGLAG